MGDRVKGIWGELRRRRVVRTAAGYLAVAFIVLQLGEILFPAFDLGPAALRALFAFLLAVFPIVIALSWVYDVTSSGVQRTDEGMGERARVGRGRLVGRPLRRRGRSCRTARFVDRGAALVDMSAAGDQAYLGDGIAEEILNILASVDGLQVAARTSSFAFRESDDVREIGGQFNVANVLEGSVRRVDSELRITAQLIDSATGFHIWSQTYDRVDSLGEHFLQRSERTSDCL